MADKILDASGLNCPLPVLKTKKALSSLSAGQHLEVIATDPGSKTDMFVFTEATGNRMVESREEGGKFIYVIEKAS
ncbi:MAG: sulfurtransferase TusA family protein [Rhodospirillales bacterium]|jgi:tRNA 2-thiouridine synthesizing protein A